MKKMIKLITYALVLIMTMMSIPVYAEGDKVEIRFAVGDSVLSINGTDIQVETPYVVGAGVTLVPLRVISEAFDVDVKWYEKSKSITLSDDYMTIVLQIGKTIAYVNGEEETLLSAPEITSNGYTMVPLRFLSEKLGAEVSYDETTRRITIVREKKEVSDDIIAIMGAGYYYDGNVRYYYINREGEILLETESYISRYFSEGLMEIKKDGKYGYINERWEIEIEPQFEEVFPFKEGLAVVKEEGKYGFINKEGKPIIKPEYEFAYSFNEGFAVVQKNDKYGYINQKGEVVIDMQFDRADTFSENMAAVKIGDKWGFIDKNGKILIEPRFDRVGRESEGMKLVVLGEKIGYVDTNSGFIIEPQYESSHTGITEFSEGLAIVRINGKVGFINKKGQIVIEPRDGEMESSFHDGVALWQQEGGVMKYINKFGEIVPFPNPDERLYPKWLGDKWGYADETDEIVIEPKFDGAWKFSEGLALVRVDQKYYFINQLGEIVFENPYSPYMNSYFKMGMTPVVEYADDGVWRHTFMNKKGEILIEPGDWFGFASFYKIK